MTNVRRLHAAPIPNNDPLAELAASWVVHLRAERKSPNTIAAYRLGVDLFLRWCAEQNAPAQLDRRTVDAWMADLLDEGEASTARLRLGALRSFSAWLADEDEIPKDQLRNVKPPKLDQRVVPALSEAEAEAMLAACTGRTFTHRRDEAILRVMLDTGARAGEMVALTLADVDVGRGALRIERGKGGKGRVVPFGPRAGQALDRYLRARKSHPYAGSPAVWLAAGRARRELTYAGLRETLRTRAAQAGVVDFHPHRLRHTRATTWLAAGGSEGGLMAIGGWSRRDLIDRYTRDSAERRVAEEFRRLGMGE